MALDLGGNWHKELQRLELSQFLTIKQIWEVLPPYESEPITSMDFVKLYKELNVFNPKAGPIDFRPTPRDRVVRNRCSWRKRWYWL
nr:hypothetical protein [Polynucleobacter necessarius]